MAAESLCTDVANGILSKLLSLATEEASLALGFEGELKRLSVRLQSIQALMSDAEGKFESSVRVRLWMQKLQAAASSADAVLDEMRYEGFRQKVEVQDGMTDKVRDFFSSSNYLAFRFMMAHKIQNINSSINQIYKEASDEIGLKPIDLINTNTIPKPVKAPGTHPYTIEKIVGRDDDKSRIVDILLKSNTEEDLLVIGIVGMPGQGKTALAQLVYKDDKVVSHFDERVWICVSDDFEAVRLLNEMIQYFPPTPNPPLSNTGAIIKELQEKLKGKRFLLALDDVWNESREKWEEMRSALVGIGGSRGSKILVTTRSEAVVSTMKPSLAHPLKGLSDDDSWEMFRLRAFGEDSEAVETPDLVAIGREIVGKCRGVALAIKAIGGVMSSKKSEREWLSIQGSQIWELPGNGVVLASLRLSYDHLPTSSLKQCFAYCSMFSKDYDIPKGRLIQLWMALGLLNPPKGSHLAMEDIGNEYFDTLLCNSLLQDAAQDMYGNTITCKMHDLVHDLAMSTSKGYCSTLEDSEVNDVDPEVVHLSLTSSGGKMPKILKENIRRLQTLFFGGELLGDMLMKFRFLRVLVLESSSKDYKLPSSVRKLKHLRYLEFSGSSDLTLPSSITKLYNLQTLKLVGKVREIPETIGNLINLRHLELEYDEGLKLIGIGQLSCLQTLSFFEVRRERGCKIGELGGLRNLKGKLDIYGLENVENKEEAESASLSTKPNIHSLGFHWKGRISDEDEEYSDEKVLEGLKPHPNLQSLRIRGFRSVNFGGWFKVVESGALLLDKLVDIELRDCKRCEQIPALGHLPCLKEIVIDGMDNVKCIGPEFYGGKGKGASSDGGEAAAEVVVTATAAVFPALRKLKLLNMPNLKEWVDHPRSSTKAAFPPFPNLEHLKIGSCPELIAIPSHFPSLKTLVLEGLRNIPEELFRNNSCSRSLRELRIIGCGESSYLPDSVNDLVALETLEIFDCNNLVVIPDMHGLTSLRKLFIGGCGKLTGLGIDLVALEDLDIFGCDELMYIRDDITNIHRRLTSLHRLSIWGCEKLSGLPSGLRDCTSLEELTLSCPALLRFPDLGCPNRLREMGLGGITELRLRDDQPSDYYFPWPDYDCPSSSSSSSSVFSSLKFLLLDGRGMPKIHSLPEQIQHLPALTSLVLFNFDGLEVLPEWLGNLSSLEQLEIQWCENLKHMPPVAAMRRLTKLQRLRIYWCPLLQEGCRKGIGTEWHKIAHIPNVEI